MLGYAHYMSIRMPAKFADDMISNFLILGQNKQGVDHFIKADGSLRNIYQV